MLIHRLSKTTMGNGGSMTKSGGGAGIVMAKPLGRTFGSGIIREVYDSTATRPTEVLRNIKVAKSRMPKKYITFE